MSTAPAHPTVLHLSLVVGGVLRDRSGERLGKVDDLLVRLGEDYPPVTGVLASVAGRPVFVPASEVAEIAHGRVDLLAEKIDLQRFERRYGEVLLRKDVLDRQLINVDGARLVRANEIEIARIDGWYRVVGVDTACAASSAGSRRAGSARTCRRARSSTGRASRRSPGTCRACACASPTPSWPACTRPSWPIWSRPRRTTRARRSCAPSAETRSSRPTCSRSSTPSTGASSSRSARDAEVAAVLERMETDDAVDLLGDLPEERREGVVRLLPAVQRRRVRALAGYDPATAGGLMSPEFVCLYAQATKQEAIGRVERSRAPADTLAWVYVMNLDRRLKGAIALADLLRADPGLTMGEAATFLPPRVTAEAELEEVARLMTDYDLTVVPVVDERDQIMGVVSVDDVLEMVLPRGWRRRFDVLGGRVARDGGPQYPAVRVRCANALIRGGSGRAPRLA